MVCVRLCVRVFVSGWVRSRGGARTRGGAVGCLGDAEGGLRPGTWAIDAGRVARVSFACDSPSLPLAPDAFDDLQNPAYTLRRDCPSVDSYATIICIILHSRWHVEVTWGYCTIIRGYVSCHVHYLLYVI